jgi:hypothetical protein
MFNLFKRHTKSVHPLQNSENPIVDALVSEETKASINQKLIDQLESGTIAEMQYAALLKASSGGVLKFNGKLINLQLLLSMKNNDGLPKWSLVNPHFVLTEHSINEFGVYKIPCYKNTYSNFRSGVIFHIEEDEKYIPTTFVLLPKTVREIVNFHTTDNPFEYVAILYPNNIQENSPCAVIGYNAELKQHFCLAHWRNNNSENIQAF